MSDKQTEEIIKSLISDKKDSTWKDAVDFREANKDWLNKSAKIAIKITRALRDKKLTQRSLAEKLSVSAQQVNKILKGRENLTLETVSKIESALNIELINIISQAEIQEQVAQEVIKYHRKWRKAQVYEKNKNMQNSHGGLLCLADENKYPAAA